MPACEIAGLLFSIRFGAGGLVKVMGLPLLRRWFLFIKPARKIAGFPPQLGSSAIHLNHVCAAPVAQVFFLKPVRKIVGVWAMNMPTLDLAFPSFDPFR